MTGSAAASPRTNFAYVPDEHVKNEGEDDFYNSKVTLITKFGKENLNCNDTGANIKTTVFEVCGDIWNDPEYWYFIPNSYEMQQTVQITGNAVDCQSKEYVGLTEVHVTTVEE